ncbi:MAG: RidA family protein [Gemmatimonadales bacterium]|jgi:enamine deaminase RidA (YjgF/YER057c/UK114 family)
MTNHTIAQPEGWLSPRGYSNGISASGRTVSVAGQIGWNPRTGSIESSDFTAQATRALRNVVAVLAAADAKPEHLVRMTWFIKDRATYMAARADIGEAYREIVGRHFPAMSVVVVHGLIEPDADVEIEATAIVPE